MLYRYRLYMTTWPHQKERSSRGWRSSESQKFPWMPLGFGPTETRRDSCRVGMGFHGRFWELTGIRRAVLSEMNPRRKRRHETLQTYRRFESKVGSPASHPSSGFAAQMLYFRVRTPFKLAACSVSLALVRFRVRCLQEGLQFQPNPAIVVWIHPSLMPERKL